MVSSEIVMTPQVRVEVSDAYVRIVKIIYIRMKEILADVHGL